MMGMDIDTQLKRLSCSKFRSRFHLDTKSIMYIQTKGMDTIKQHAYDFVEQRLADSWIENDGHQTPMNGHPVFVAMHATACCCRGCLMKWHHIVKGVELSEEQIQWIVDLLIAWIYLDMNRKS